MSEIYIVKKQEKSRPHRGDMLIYRIYYGDEIVYIGKTKQALSTRIKSHLYGRKYETRINIDRMTHIDYSVYKTPADLVSRLLDQQVSSAIESYAQDQWTSYRIPSKRAVGKIHAASAL